jgi:hypothetical protein
MNSPLHSSSETTVADERESDCAVAGMNSNADAATKATNMLLIKDAAPKSDESEAKRLWKPRSMPAFPVRKSRIGAISKGLAVRPVHNAQHQEVM